MVYDHGDANYKMTMFRVWHIWVCLKMLCTPEPNGFADHYPYEMAISLGILTQHFQTIIAI